MQIRIFFVVIVAPIIWWFSHNLVRNDEANWMLWLLGPEGSGFSKFIYGAFSFAGVVIIIGSLVLFARRTYVGFLFIFILSYGTAWAIGVGHKSMGDPMTPHALLTMALGLMSSVPLVFADLIAGKQIDIVGSGGGVGA